AGSCSGEYGRGLRTPEGARPRGWRVRDRLCRIDDNRCVRRRTLDLDSTRHLLSLYAPLFWYVRIASGRYDASIACAISRAAAPGRTRSIRLVVLRQRTQQLLPEALRLIDPRVVPCVLEYDELHVRNVLQHPPVQLAAESDQVVVAVDHRYRP